MTEQISTRTEPTAPGGGGSASQKRQGTVVDSTLGTLLTMYHGSGLDRFSRYTFLYPGLLIILGLLGYGLWRGYYGYTRFGSVAAFTWSRPWLLGGAGLSFALAVWLFFRRRQADRTIGLYRKGLRLRYGRRKNEPWRWNEIAGITVSAESNQFLGLPLLTRNRLVIYPNVGEPLRLDDRIQNLDKLTHQIKEHYYPYLRKALKTDFFEDHWVHFGPLAIHRQALRVQKKLIPWKQVENIEVQEGRLIITLGDDRPVRIPTVKIPNLEVCLEIIQEGVIP